MRRQSRSLQVSILFAYFLFLLAGVSFDNMQKIKNGTCIVSACYDEKQMREEWEQKLIWDKEDFPGLPQEGDTVGISYYFYDEKGRLDSVKSYGIAENGGMVRIDVFHVNGKYYFVPVYTADVVKKVLPNRAATAHKPYGEWKVMEDVRNRVDAYEDSVCRYREMVETAKYKDSIANKLLLESKEIRRIMEKSK